MAKKKASPVAIIMGSQSDWETMEHASDKLKEFGIAHDCHIISAHCTPERLYEFAKSAKEAGVKVIIAGAGGAAHLPGMAASMTTVPVLGVPVESKTLKGIDSLLSIAQMPAGIPVGTLAIGKAGATNAALLAASILAVSGRGTFQKTGKLSVPSRLNPLKSHHNDKTGRKNRHYRWWATWAHDGYCGSRTWLSCAYIHAGQRLPRFVSIL